MIFLTVGQPALLWLKQLQLPLIASVHKCFHGWVNLYRCGLFLFPKSSKMSNFLQCVGSIWDLFANQYLFQKNKSWPIVKDRPKWNIHWNFNSLILSCHTRSISILAYLLQWVMIYSFGINLNSIQWQSMGHDLFFWNKYWFGNRSQFDPLPCLLPVKNFKSLKPTLRFKVKSPT